LAHGREEKKKLGYIAKREKELKGRSRGGKWAVLWAGSSTIKSLKGRKRFMERGSNPQQ